MVALTFYKETETRKKGNQQKKTNKPTTTNITDYYRIMCLYKDHSYSIRIVLHSYPIHLVIRYYSRFGSIYSHDIYHVAIAID